LPLKLTVEVECDRLQKRHRGKRPRSRACERGPPANGHDEPPPALDGRPAPDIRRGLKGARTNLEQMGGRIAPASAPGRANPSGLARSAESDEEPKDNPAPGRARDLCARRTGEKPNARSPCALSPKWCGPLPGCGGGSGRPHRPGFARRPLPARSSQGNSYAEEGLRRIHKPGPISANAGTPEQVLPIHGEMLGTMPPEIKRFQLGRIDLEYSQESQAEKSTHK